MSLLLTLWACLGGAPREPTVTLGALPQDFTPTVVDPDAGVVFGFGGGPFVGVTARTLAAWRLTGETLAATGPAGEGWYVAAEGHGAELWAIVATARADKTGSDYRLVVERDGRWEERGPIPATSLTALTVGDGGEGYAVGVGQLWRTTDGGRSWTKLSGAPMPGQVAEQLGLVDGRLLVSGARLMRSDDHGEAFRVQHDEAVLATDGVWVVTGQRGAARVGQLSGDAVTWRGSLPEGLRPAAIGASPGGVRVLANEEGTSRLVVFTSRDGGNTFTERRLSGVSDPAWVGLGEALWWVDVERKLRGVVPPKAGE